MVVVFEGVAQGGSRGVVSGCWGVGWVCEGQGQVGCKVVKVGVIEGRWRDGHEVAVCVSVLLFASDFRQMVEMQMQMHEMQQMGLQIAHVESV